MLPPEYGRAAFIGVISAQTNSLCSLPSFMGTLRDFVTKRMNEVGKS